MEALERIMRVQIDTTFWEDAKRTILAGDYGMVDIHDNAHAATMKASAALKLRAALPKGAVLAIGTEETPEAKNGTADHVADFLARQNGGA